MRRPSRPALAAVLLALLTACSGGSGQAVKAPSVSPAPSATPAVTPAPRASTPTAAPPTATTTPAATVPSVAWKGCGGGFECGTLTVPLDPATPARGTVGLSLTRHRATGKRIGALLVDPGGPGDSAVDFVQDNYLSFPGPIRQQFDIAAFDPRGVGHTAPVRCGSTADLDAFFHIDYTPDTPAEVSAFDAGNKKLALGCQQRSARILPYTSTKVVAQDMDRVRQALGDEKLTYLGYSYGTAMGTAYLDAFPAHVRALVLDGAIDPTLTWDQFVEGQAGGFEKAFNAFLADCDKNRCAFRKTVTGDLGAAYDKLAASAESKQLPGAGARRVGPAEFSTGVLLGMYSRSLWPTLGDALADAQHGDGNALLGLNDAYLQRTDEGYGNIIEANNAVTCVDRPWPRTDAPYQALAAKVGKAYPRFGTAIALSGGVCEFWPLPAVSTPHSVSGAAGPPVVVIGGIYDPATPYSWSKGLVAQLAHGVLLTHTSNGHTIYRSGATSCIVKRVNAYLVSLTVPTAVTC